MTDELHGQDGYRLRLIRITPELLEMEAIYGGTGQMPPLHLHPSQTERFEVLEGTVRTVIDGTPRDYAAGKSVEVPAGTMPRWPPTRRRACAAAGPPECAPVLGAHALDPQSEWALQD
jgi:mannose-6-phosphate isomerase-like protein (cupin superfamily)